MAISMAFVRSWYRLWFESLGLLLGPSWFLGIMVASCSSYSVFNTNLCFSHLLRK
ncbi:LOW QUALITY PROTEIN: hypothetical protein PanWU01x14_197020 [Parasponia andersonii]|uniref:Uncharacterized protein n=1 Tax=Parasponia andersonii TaxID=3476 RepID=A0A2P5BZB6_PARAD|nr:LOW QUALITY PROTEIN: hypothetical protein PanWU01x14_197020 [Parasponia andersonii]